MAKNYLIAFGQGNPTANTGLTPTFLVFKVLPSGGATTPPGITEVPSATGLYYFTYEPVTSIAFVIDGGSTLGNLIRYIPGTLDPIQAVDEQLGSIGGSTGLLGLIGGSASSFGSTSADPTTVFGYLKRMQEFNEGNSTFNKSTNLWDIYSRGSSTLLIEKALVDSPTTVTKS